MHNVHETKSLVNPELLVQQIVRDNRDYINELSEPQ